MDRVDHEHSAEIVRVLGIQLWCPAFLVVYDVASVDCCVVRYRWIEVRHVPLSMTVPVSVTYAREVFAAVAQNVSPLSCQYSLLSEGRQGALCGVVISRRKLEPLEERLACMGDLECVVGCLSNRRNNKQKDGTAGQHGQSRWSMDLMAELCKTNNGPSEGQP